MLSKSELSVLRGEPAHPLVEVAEDDLRARDAVVVDERREPRRLVAALEHRGAEMDVVDVQRRGPARDRGRRAGRRAARTSATTGRTGCGATIGKRLRTTLPKRWLRRCRTEVMTQPMPSAAPISSAWPAPAGPAPITSCSATTSASMSRSTSAMRGGDRAPIHAAAAMDVVGRDPERRRAPAISPRSLLSLQDPDERADDLFPERPPPPVVQRDLLAGAQVALVVLEQPRRDRGIAQRRR